MMRPQNCPAALRSTNSPQDLKRWLTTRLAPLAVAGTPVVRLRVIRTSSTDVEQWKASATTSFASLERENDPDVRAALALGFDVVRRDIIGDSTRASLGADVFELRMHHAPGGRGRSQVGVFLLVGQTLFLYLLGSARAGNLQTENEERKGNAATEFITAGIREMSGAGRALVDNYRPELHAREHERIVRSELHGAELKTTLMRYRALVFAPTRLDMLVQSDQQAFTFGTMVGSAAVEALVKSMNRQEIVLQANGSFYEDIRKAPFTHGPANMVERDPRSGREIITVNTGRLAPVDDFDAARSMLRQLVDRILVPGKNSRPGRPPVTDWEAVGALAGELGLPLRRPEDLKRDVLIAHVSPATQAKAVQSLFADRWIHGWRHGFYVRPVKAKVPQSLDLGPHVEIVEDGDVTYYRCPIDMPTPEGGWGITDDEWDQVLERRYPERRRDVPRASAGGVLPLGGITHTDSETGRQYRLFTNNRYILRSRAVGPADAAHPGAEIRSIPGWADCETTQHATIPAASFHQSLGVAMQAALSGMEAATQPAFFNLAATRPQESLEARLQATCETALEELQDAEDQLAGAEDALNRARGVLRRHPGGKSQDALQRAARALERAEARRESADEVKSRADKALAEAGVGDVATARPEEVDTFVQTATAEFTAVALTKCEGLAPSWLKQACHWFIDDWRLVVQEAPGERDKVVWSCQMTLQIVGSDETVTVPLHGEVFSTANRRTGTAPTNVEDWAWRFFYLGEDMLEVARRAGIDATHDKNSYVYQLLYDWLADAVLEPSLRTAALHCPIPATRRVIYYLVTQEANAVRGLDANFVSHISSVYSATGVVTSWTWSRDTHELVRRAIAALASRPSGSAPVHSLLTQLSVDGTSLLRLAREPRAGTESVANTPVPYLTKNFDHTRAVTDRRISLRPCPHTDCPERKRGGTPRCTIPIRTPETEDGYAVLCPHCRRLPLPRMRNVFFPADYLRPWSGRFGHGSHHTARKSPVPTFLQPDAADPGPAPALPDTGCQPRPVTKAPKVNNRYIPRHQRDQMRLGARTFLLEGLNEADEARAVKYLHENGGRRAQQLRESVTAVVVGRLADTGPRVRRARELGVQVVEVRQLLNSHPERWNPA